MIATPPAPPAPTARVASVKTVSHLEPAVPRRRPGRTVTALRTRRELRAAPARSTIGSIVAAGRDDDRCEHRTGALRCVRGPHLEAPRAHVLVAGAPDPRRGRTAARVPDDTPAPSSARAAAVAAVVCCA